MRVESNTIRDVIENLMRLLYTIKFPSRERKDCKKMKKPKPCDGDDKICVYTHGGHKVCLPVDISRSTVGEVWVRLENVLDIHWNNPSCRLSWNNKTLR